MAGEWAVGGLGFWGDSIVKCRLTMNMASSSFSCLSSATWAGGEEGAGT